MNFSRAVKSTRVSNAVSAGTTDVESSSVDMKGFDAVAFEVAFGTITTGAVTSCKLQGSHDNSSWTGVNGDLVGTGVTVADDDDNQIFVLDLDRSIFRYVRCVVDRGTQNAVVDSIVAHQYKADKQPVSQPNTTTVEYNHAPALGTA